MLGLGLDLHFAFCSLGLGLGLISTPSELGEPRIIPFDGFRCSPGGRAGLTVYRTCAPPSNESLFSEARSEYWCPKVQTQSTNLGLPSYERLAGACNKLSHGNPCTTFDFFGTCAIIVNVCVNEVEPPLFEAVYV